MLVCLNFRILHLFNKLGKMMKIKTIGIRITLLLLMNLNAIIFAQAVQYDYVYRIIADSLVNPWEIKQIDNDWIIFTERIGKVSKLNISTGERKLLLKFGDVLQVSESGLLGMELHPNFPDTPYVYLVYTYGSLPRFWEKVVRYRYATDTLVEPLKLLDSINAFYIHDGSRLMIGTDRKLYITTGDADLPESALDNNSLNGKVLRINLDGSIPEDNPFGNAVWSFGHRNAQGIVEVKGKIIISEHGPETDDEINIIQKGRNFGWPRVIGYCDDNYPGEKEYCAQNNVIEPVISLYPEVTIAVAGLEYYSNPENSVWDNSFILATLKAGILFLFKMNDDLSKVDTMIPLIKNQFKRLRCVRKLRDGRIIIGTSNYDSYNKVPDKLIEITPKVSSKEGNENPSGSDIFKIIYEGNKIIIESNNQVTLANKVQIFDIVGRLCFESTFNERIEINYAEFFRDGVSIVQCSNGKGTYTKLIYGFR